jgi:predicted nucleic acid-binding protein
MKFLLDAGTVACVMRGSAMTVVQLRMILPTDVSIPAPALQELHAAILRVRDGRRRAEMAKDVDRFAAYVGVVPLSAAAAVAAARLERRLRVGIARLSQADRLNVAIAQTGSMVLVSTRALAMRDIPGLAVENWNELVSSPRLPPFSSHGSHGPHEPHEPHEPHG